jgi:hypothetical protein
LLFELNRNLNANSAEIEEVGCDCPVEPGYNIIAKYAES